MAHSGRGDQEGGATVSQPRHKKLIIGSRYVIFRRGNYVNRRLVPLIERGHFMSFTASWKWGQIEFGLTRWL